jgi:hypothetical protein
LAARRLHQGVGVLLFDDGHFIVKASLANSFATTGGISELKVASFGLHFIGFATLRKSKSNRENQQNSEHYSHKNLSCYSIL